MNGGATGATGLELLGQVITSLFGWLGTVTSTIQSNPLMLIGIALAVIFSLIGIFKSLTNQRRRRGR